MLDLLAKVPAKDTHLVYVVRKALRDHLANRGVASWILAQPAISWSQSDIRALADVALAVKSEAAGTFVLRHLDVLEASRPLLSAALNHSAQYAPSSEQDTSSARARKQSA